MTNKYLITGVVLFIFLTSLIYIGFNNSHSYHVVDDQRDGECLVRTNNYTGSSCLILGSRCLVDAENTESYTRLKSCNHK